MFRQRFLIHSIVVFTGSLTAPIAAAQTILYVNDDASGTNDGSSWTDAFVDLQSALAVAQSGDEIWVATGTYKPTSGTDRTTTFQLITGVEIYGGFHGTEASVGERVGLFDQTILSGDLSGNDPPTWSDCCLPHRTFGCDHDTCVADVCAEKAYCCADYWSFACANLAVALCPGTCDGNIENAYHVVTGSGVDATAVLDGFIITGGNANMYDAPHERGGGMVVESGSPTLARCTFRGNRARSDGGGLYNRDHGDPVLTDCTFVSNVANRGAGMYHDTGDPVLTDCMFVNNMSDDYGGGVTCHGLGNPLFSACSFDENFAFTSWGGGMFSQSDATLSGCIFTGNWSGYAGGGLGQLYSNPTLTNCTFNLNAATYWGGGMDCGGSNPILTDCTFSGNEAGYDGGGMCNAHESNPELFNCTFTGNVANRGDGGAVKNRQDSSSTLTNCAFSSNAARVGGAICNRSGSHILTDCHFNGNQAGSYGGAIYNSNVYHSDVDACTFVGNAAGNGGGAVYNWSGSTPVFTDCTFDGNVVARGSGGAIRNAADSRPGFANCVFTRNTANHEGGAVSNWAHSDPVFTNCTFTTNVATERAGGILDVADSRSVLTNCILWANFDGGETDESAQIDSDGEEPVVTYSCIRDADPSDDYVAFGGTLNGNIDDNPLFVDGGDRDNTIRLPELDLHLQSESPCINTGSNYAPELTAVDIEGNERVQNCRVDMGAYESPYVSANPLDCNANGEPDECDIVDGTSEDCSGNSIPDECEPDCNGNGEADSCDILDATSPDQNDNGIPDECEFCPTAAPEMERLSLPGYPVSRKIRYLSFRAGDTGRSQAVRVTFSNVPSPYAHWNDTKLWVQESQEYCENAGTAQDDPCPTNVGGLPNTTFRGAELGCDPYFTDWTQYALVHVVGEGIVPGGVYDIQVIDSICSTANEDDYSPPLTLTQSGWADVVKDCSTTPCGPSDGSTGIVDVTAILDKYKNLAGNVKKVRADIEGCTAGNCPVPDQVINITDVTYCLGAFLGETYPPPGFPPPGDPPACP